MANLVALGSPVLYYVMVVGGIVAVFVAIVVGYAIAGARRIAKMRKRDLEAMMPDANEEGSQEAAEFVEVPLDSVESPHSPRELNLESGPEEVAEEPDESDYMTSDVENLGNLLNAHDGPSPLSDGEGATLTTPLESPVLREPVSDVEQEELSEVEGEMKKHTFTVVTSVCESDKQPASPASVSRSPDGQAESTMDTNQLVSDCDSLDLRNADSVERGSDGESVGGVTDLEQMKGNEWTKVSVHQSPVTSDAASDTSLSSAASSPTASRSK